MGKAKMVYKDKAGNTVYKRFIKTRGTIQFTVKNRQGRLVNPQGTHSVLRKAGILKKRRR